MSVDLGSWENFPFWKGDSEKSRLRRETEDARSLQLSLKKQKDLLGQIRSGKLKVPDGGARVEVRIAELEATVNRLARPIEQKEEEGRSEHSVWRHGSRGRALRNLEEQLASRLVRGSGSPKSGVADVKEKIEPFTNGKPNHASEDVGMTASGQQLSPSSDRVNESRRVRDHLAEDADILQASRSDQGNLARESGALNEIIEDDVRRVSIADAQPVTSDSSSLLGDGGSGANSECEETSATSMPRKANRERDANTRREAQHALGSSAKDNPGGCVDQVPHQVRAYPLVGKAGGGMCWLRNGVLEPIGGRLSREAIRATRVRMRKELAEEASKEADRLAILLKISEDEEEERSVLQDPKFSTKETVSYAGKEEDEKCVVPDERFNMRGTRMIGIQEAAELLRTQAEYQSDARDELISRRPPIHKQLGHKLPPIPDRTAARRDPNHRPGSALVWAHRGRDEEEYSSDELSTDEDEVEDEDGDNDNEDD